MYAWLGIDPPAKKSKQSTEERREVQRKYDREERKRDFQAGWLAEFKWLLWDNNNKQMFCKTCRSCYGSLATSKLPDKGMFQKYSKAPFVMGSSNLRHSTLMDHVKSEGHRLAETHLTNRQVEKSQAASALQKLNAAAFDKLEILFRNAHAITKNNRPFSDFQWLAALDKMKGIQVGETYLNDTACKDFVTAICDVERQKLAETINAARFITILSDGSTDVSVYENEIIYVRFAAQGEPHTMFVSIVRVPKADANGIFRAISGALDELNVDVKHKIVCFTADGAIVNTGHLSGVISKMREAWNPSIVMIKCLMHRVELAVKEVFTNDPHYKSFQSVLTTLFTLYHRSPLMRAGLEETFACLTPPATPIMPSRVGGTRFVGHTERAIQKLWQGYKAYILHLTQVRTKNNW